MSSSGLAEKQPPSTVTAAASRVHAAAADARLAPRLEELRRKASEVLAFGGLGLLPAVVVTAIFASSIHHGWGSGFGFDFHAFWQAGRDVLHGRSPYPDPTVAQLRHEDNFVYPALAAFLFVPLALLPFKVAAVVFAAILFACAGGALWILGVRDWRCYGAAYLSIPVIDAVRLGAISLVLAFVVALVWRYRDRTVVVGLGVAFLIAVKLFLWPLGLWLLVRRRFAAAGVAAAAALAATTAAWAAIGFVGLADYPTMLHTLSDVLLWKGYSIAALIVDAHFSVGTGQLVELVVGGLLIAALPFVARRRGDAAAFVLALSLAFALSPIVWGHYYVVLLVPIAIARPRLSPLWLVPLLFWLALNQSNGHIHKVIVGLLVWGLVTLLALRDVSTPTESASTAAGRPGLEPA
jgi:alpha-1,2-mannosyltransferase